MDRSRFRTNLCPVHMKRRIFHMISVPNNKKGRKNRVKACAFETKIVSALKIIERYLGDLAEETDTVRDLYIKILGDSLSYVGERLTGSEINSGF